MPESPPPIMNNDSPSTYVRTYYTPSPSNSRDSRKKFDAHRNNNNNNSKTSVYTRYNNPNYRAMALEAKKRQDEDVKLWKDLQGPFYSIDVECVATGYGNSNRFRYPCRVALVGSNEECLLDAIVMPECIEDVVSYLTPLTGLTEETCVKEGRPLEDIIKQLKQILPSSSVLVGQTIAHDIEWLNLEQGKDFRTLLDISIMFRQALPCKKTINEMIQKCGENSLNFGNNGDIIPIFYRSFSLRHTCLHLLDTDIQAGVHNPVTDAMYSLRLFHKYREADPNLLRAIRDTLNRAPPTPGFSSTHPVIDGVCMSKRGFIMKHNARFIWKWYTEYATRK